MNTKQTDYRRRPSTVVRIGNLLMGGDNPIRVQSMTTTDTNDTLACVEQTKRIVAAGGELVRLTTQGMREANNMKNISEALRAEGINVPLAADVHFNPNVADVAALYAEKVRINPGNYVDPARTFKQLSYTDEQYAAELQKIEQRFVPFLNICREHGTAIRIGVNHGSLSDRIMSRYGDTPAGIVESCMEFLRICQREQFNDVVISIKASNTVVMVQSVRLLVQTMDKEQMHYPLHLGVTEAGEGEDGRIKSAVGIGALLTEGIGDTIRVSLSEEPEAEIPVAKKLVESIEECAHLRAEAEASISNDTITLNIAEPDWETLQLKAAMAVGALLIDQKAHQLVITQHPTPNTSPSPSGGRGAGQGGFPTKKLVQLADDILQAARIKFTKTEYISCPGCGRTLYDLRTTIQRIKQATAHLKGLKIGIMGCIVNGPGEMADADYGYVGAAKGKISLYRKKVCVEKNIPEELAVEKLLQLIEEDNRGERRGMHMSINSC
ncbi:MAG: (E)-4-hydroxy-3-methylbut-2-enyl-diphosphate synthase [Prevotella sp.]|nr:(E)-4-hydroxy-3-methylbut-2-enyl-diphosphate synthase [Prevotella sp.]